MDEYNDEHSAIVAQVFNQRLIRLRRKTCDTIA